MKKIFAMITVFCICLCMSAPVFADTQETERDDYDWDNVDWTTFEWRNLETEVYESLADWLETEADLETAILVTTTTGDGWVGELWATVLSARFQQEPYAFLQVAAQLDEATIQDIVIQIACLGFYSREEVETFFGSLAFPQKLTVAEQAVLDAIIETAEENWNVKLPSPKTADPLGSVIAAMALSGLGGGLMIWHKRNRSRSVT